MTVYQFATVPSLDTDARYREWVSECITALTTVGMVQTVDTGQVDPSALLTADVQTAPSAAPYVVMRFNDSLQASHPLFIRLAFGVVSASIKMPQMWLTVGRGSDGSGNITGTLLSASHLATPTASGASSATVDGAASGGEGYVALLSACGAAGTRVHPWFIIERSPSGEAVYMVGHIGIGSNIAPPSTTHSSVAGLPGVFAFAYASGSASRSIIPVVTPYSSNGVVLSSAMSLAAGSLGPIFPWVCFAPGQEPVQLRSAATYPGGDAPSGPFMVNLGGEEARFLPIKISPTHCAMGVALDPASQNGIGSTHLGLALRWES